MFSAIWSMLSGLMYVVIAGIILLAGFVIFLGVTRLKRIFRGLRGGGTLGSGRRREGRQRDRGGRREPRRFREHGRVCEEMDDYEFGETLANRDPRDEEYERGHGRYKDYRDYDEPYREYHREKVYKKTPSFNLNIGGNKFLKQYKTQEEFEEYIKELVADKVGDNATPETKDTDFIVSQKSTQDIAKTCIEETMKSYRAELCTKEDLARVIRDMKKEDYIPRTDYSDFNIVDSGKKDDELFIVVECNGFNIKDLLGTKTAGEFLREQGQFKDTLAKATITKVTVMRLYKDEDIFVCKFKYVDDLPTKANTLAKDVLEGTPNAELSRVVVKHEIDEHRDLGKGYNPKIVVAPNKIPRRHEGIRGVKTKVENTENTEKVENTENTEKVEKVGGVGSVKMDIPRTEQKQESVSSDEPRGIRQVGQELDKLKVEKIPNVVLEDTDEEIAEEEEKERLEKLKVSQVGK